MERIEIFLCGLMKNDVALMSGLEFFAPARLSVRGVNFFRPFVNCNLLLKFGDIAQALFDGLEP